MPIPISEENNHELMDVIESLVKPDIHEKVVTELNKSHQRYRVCPSVCMPAATSSSGWASRTRGRRI